MTSTTEETQKKPSKLPLVLIFFVVFIDLIGFGIIIPVLPTVAEELGATPMAIAWLLSSYSIMQFFFTPIWGRLSDGMGRRPVLLISLAASTIGYLIWGFAHSLPLLFLSRIVAGAGNGNIAVAQAYIADVTTLENRAKGMGMVGAAFGLGFVLGPAIGGLCSVWGAHNYIGFVAAFFSGMAFLLAATKLPEPEKRSQAGHERFVADPAFYFKTLLDPRLRVPIVLFFISTFAFANMEATLVLFTERNYKFGITENSIMFTFVGVMMVLVQGGLIGRLNKRVSEKILVCAGALITAAGLLLVGLSNSVVMLYVALAFLAAGTGITTPSNQSILSKQARAQNVGGALGVGQSMSTLGRILGPLAAAWAFSHVGIRSPYYLGAAVMGLAFFVGLFLPNVPRGGAVQEVAPPVIAETGAEAAT